MSPRCAIHFDDGVYAPGDDVQGLVEVTEGGRIDLLELEVRYWERTTDGFEALAARHSSGDVLCGEVTAGQWYPFVIRLPLDATPAYRSANGQLGWTLEAHVRIDEDDAWNEIGILQVGRPGAAQNATDLAGEA